MRHFLLAALAIAALAFGMGEASATAILVTLTGCARGLATGGSCTHGTAVAIASVALATDHHLRLTTGGAVEQTCAALHRALLPM